jgi:adenylate kinase
LFDGYPRTIGQAEAFDGIIKEFNHKINLVLNFLVDRAVIAKRILGRFKCAKCGKIYNDFFAKPAIDGKCDICEGTEFVRRLDDNEESLKRRLSEYYEKTGVLVDFYSKRQLLRDIEADNKPEEVMKAIFDNLKTKC